MLSPAISLPHCAECWKWFSLCKDIGGNLGTFPCEFVVLWLLLLVFGMLYLPESAGMWKFPSCLQSAEITVLAWPETFKEREAVYVVIRLFLYNRVRQRQTQAWREFSNYLGLLALWNLDKKKQGRGFEAVSSNVCQYSTFLTYSKSCKDTEKGHFYNQA